MFVIQEGLLRERDINSLWVVVKSNAGQALVTYRINLSPFTKGFRGTGAPLEPNPSFAGCSSELATIAGQPQQRPQEYNRTRAVAQPAVGCCATKLAVAHMT